MTVSAAYVCTNGQRRVAGERRWWHLQQSTSADSRDWPAHKGNTYTFTQTMSQIQWTSQSLKAVSCRVLNNTTTTAMQPIVSNSFNTHISTSITSSNIIFQRPRMTSWKQTAKALAHSCSDDCCLVFTSHNSYYSWQLTHQVHYTQKWWVSEWVGRFV